jgi:RNA polymerase sigma-70 factor (ECF subfamily)
LKEGDGLKSFEALYTEYYDRVYCFLYRLCADGDLAEDMTQETFLQAYTSFHRFRGECELFTWLASIGKHVYFKYLKKNKLDLDSANLELVVNTYCDGCVDPEEHMRRKDVEKAVRAIIEGIPKKYRDVILLRIYAELSFSQIALVLKISENSAKVIYFRAKKMLVEVLKHEFEL